MGKLKVWKQRRKLMPPEIANARGSSHRVGAKAAAQVGPARYLLLGWRLG